MALAIADFVADGEVVGVAAAAFTEWLHVLQRGGFKRDMLAADPTRHDAMKLARDHAVNLDPGMTQTAHAVFSGKKESAALCNSLAQVFLP